MSRLIIGQITIKKERAISSTKWYYLLQPANASAPDATNYGNPPPTISTTGYSGWSETEPSYTVGSDKKLYQMVLTIYTDGTFEYSTPSLSSSYEASKAAYNEIIQAEQDIQVLEDLGLKQGYIWDNPREVAAHDNIPIYPVGSYIASGILVNGNRSITQANSNTYGLNTWISTGGIKLRYNAINLAELNTSNLNFYYPSTSQQGNKAISLGTIGAINKLVFYDFSEHPMMELSSDGMELFKYINNSNISIAKFGSSIRIGNYADNHAYVSSNGFFVYTANDAKIRIALEDNNGSPYAQIGSTLDTHYLYLSSSGLSLLTKTTGDDSHKSSLFVGLDGTAPFTRIGRVDDGHISIYSSGAEIFRKISTDTTPVSVGYFGTSNGSPWARLGAYAEDHINIDGISHGIEIFKKESTDSSPVSVAWFGAVSRIGQSDSLYTRIAPAQIDFYDGSGSSSVSLVRFTPNAFRLGAEGGARVLVQRGTYNGLEVFDENNTSVAWFGNTARIGASDSGRVTITSDSIQMYRKVSTDSVPVSIAYFGMYNNKGWARIGALEENHINVDGAYNGIEIFRKLDTDTSPVSVAWFGSTTRIGPNNDARVIINPSYFNIYNAQNDTTLSIGLASDSMTYNRSIYSSYLSSSVEITLPNIANGTTVYIQTTGLGGGIAIEDFVVGTASTGVEFSYDGNKTLTINPSSGSYFSVYYSVTANPPIWTLGTRIGSRGGFSTVIGLNNKASGNYSMAIGSGTEATGYASFASGGLSKASGDYSSALGRATRATGNDQMVIGKHNATDSTKAFIIGNGTGQDLDPNRYRNALTVDWSGNVNIASGAHYKINGTNLSASDVGAVRNSYGSLTNVFPQGFTNADSIKVGITGSVKATPTATEDTQYLFGARAIAPVLYNDTTGTTIWTGYTTLNKPSASDVGALPIGGGTLTGDLTVNGKIQGLYMVSSTTVATDSIGANSAKAAANYPITNYSTYINAGYEPVAISGDATDNSAVKAFARIYDDNGTKKIRATFRNNSSSSVSTNYYFYILWLKATSA